MVSTKNDPVLDFFRPFGDDFVIYGCGAFGKAILRHLHAAGIAPRALCDRDPLLHGKTFSGLPVLGPAEAGKRYGRSARFVIAIQGFYGSKTNRMALDSELMKYGCEKTAYVPEAYFYQTAYEGGIPGRSLTVINGAFFPAATDPSIPNASPGERFTAHQPRNPARTIFLTGDSVAYSHGVRAEESLASHLQALCNENGNGAVVRNFGGPDPFFGNVLLKVLSLGVKPGDMVFLVSAVPMHVRNEAFTRNMIKGYLAMQRHCRKHGCRLVAVNTPSIYTLDRNTFGEQARFPGDGGDRSDEAVREYGRKHVAEIREKLGIAGCPFIDWKDEAQRYRDTGAPVFIDKRHLAPGANRHCAEFLYKNAIALAEDAADASIEYLYAAALKDMASALFRHYADREDKELHGWFAAVKHPSLPPGSRIGAVVMNCNPFTYGHLHLIENAAREVDCLYVFVVEEDKSEFSFADRIGLVRAETRDLGDKIRVCPSGRFVLSTLTFAGYFTKEETLDDDKIDPSYDVAFFGGVIAVKLGITRRFVGEEPFCPVTAKYNEIMGKMLPPMGVEVCRVPRLESDDSVPISASRVRKHWRAGEWAELERLVPPTTYAFLRLQPSGGKDRV